MRNLLLRLGIKTYPYKLIEISHFRTAVIGKYDSFWQAEASLNGRIAREQNWGIKTTYLVKYKNQVLLSNHTKGK